MAESFEDCLAYGGQNWFGRQAYDHSRSLTRQTSGDSPDGYNNPGHAELFGREGLKVEGFAICEPNSGLRAKPETVWPCAPARGRHWTRDSHWRR